MSSFQTCVIANVSSYRITTVVCALHCAAAESAGVSRIEPSTVRVCMSGWLLTDAVRCFDFCCLDSAVFDFCFALSKVQYLFDVSREMTQLSTFHDS